MQRNEGMPTPASKHFGATLSLCVLSIACNGGSGTGAAAGGDVSQSRMERALRPSSPPFDEVSARALGPAPNAATTGITEAWCPRWQVLRTRTTGRRITEPGTVVEYEEIDGRLDIRAADVSIRCVRITQHRDPGDSGLVHCRSSNGCTGGLLVEDSFLSGADPEGRYGAILNCVSDECSVRRTHIVRGCDATKFEGGLVMESFLEDRSGAHARWPNERTAGRWDYCRDPDAHGDAQQITGDTPAPTWWIGNRIEGPWRYATSAFLYGNGDHRDITIDGNRLQGGGYTIYLANPSPPPSYVRVTNNTFVTDSWIQRPPDSWEGNVFNIIDDIGCLEMKRNGEWTNVLDAPDRSNGGKQVVDEDYGAQSSAVDIGACNDAIADPAERERANNGQFPREPWTGISPVPSWDVFAFRLSASGCDAGSDACAGIDLEARAAGNGDVVSPPRTTGSPRWRFRCGGSAANRAGLHPRGADLWYAYEACDGLTACSIADACDLSAEPPGRYTIEMYGESGPGSGVRVSDHAEITFTVE